MNVFYCYCREGFIGGGISTILMSIGLSYFICQYSYFICPIGRETIGYLNKLK